MILYLFLSHLAVGIFLSLLFVSKDAGNGLYFFDLDGISIQLIQIEHNGALGNY